MRLMVVLDLPADRASIPLARDAVGTALLSAGVSSECVGELAIAVSEACSHAYRRTWPAQGFQVIVGLRGHVVSVDVIGITTDVAGRGPPHPSPTRLSGADPGRALMTAFSDRVVFAASADGLWSVHLSRRVEWAHDAPLREWSIVVEPLQALPA